MNRAPRGQVGLALGAWGSVQATAAGVAMASSGVLRDLVDALAGGGRIAVGYNAVYAIEIALLVGTLWLLLPLWGRATVSPSEARAVEGGAEPALGASARDAG
jgi:BCD family chlorophyll transporter-like MFS transporter